MGVKKIEYLVINYNKCKKNKGIKVKKKNF